MVSARSGWGADRQPDPHSGAAAWPGFQGRLAAMRGGDRLHRGDDVEAWTRRFNEFVTFSLGLRKIGGALFLKDHAGFRDKMGPWFLQFVRPDAEIADVEGERVLGEARFNADGTFEFIRWNRPQHDGPA